MSNDVVVSGGTGGAVATTGGGGGGVDRVGDMSVDRGARAVSAPASTAQRQAVLTELTRKTGLSAAQASAVSDWILTPEAQDVIYREVIKPQDDRDRAALEASLHKQWGGQYKHNLQQIERVLGLLPLEVSAEIRHGRDATGQALCNKSTFILGLLQASGQAAWRASNAPAQQDGSPQELAELNAKMANRNSDYWKGPKAEANQARWRELHDQGVAAAAAPTADGAVKQRITELEDLMAKTNSAYWRGPNAESLQREYRDLIQRNGGR